MNTVRLLLGDAANNYTDEAITLMFNIAISEVEAYCRRTIDAELEYAAAQIAKIKLLRMGTEGLQSQNLSGVSENYIDGYPADIQAILNRKRKVKVL